MSESTVTPVVEPGTVAVSRIVGLNGTGRAATDTRNVLVMRELALGVPQAAIISATEAAGDKLDKGTVSRLNTQLKSLKPAQRKLILAIDPELIDPSVASTWAEAVALAERIRPGKLQAGAKREKSERDIYAEYFEWLTSEPEKLDSRIDLLLAAVAEWKSEQAEEAAAA